MILKEDIIKHDELNFVIQAYNDIIKKTVGDDIGVSFFASSEDYFDDYTSIRKQLKIKDITVTYFNDYSLEDNYDDIITDIGIATIKEDDRTYTLIKVVTPFTRERTYDFIICDSDEMDDVLKILENRRKHEDFVFKEFPVLGLDFDDIRKNTIDVLLDDEFREYCEKHFIKLKRGVVLEGKPGTGKTLTIQWIKNIALNNDIEFHSFKNVDDFIKNQDDYYDDNKKIFVFEDFDTLLRERKDTNWSPNIVLGMILNTLEGVNEINNVVSIFTTNEIQVFDSAFIRPGRIDKVYSYGLPSEDVYIDFFKSYIPDEEEYFEHIKESLSMSNTDISFAILKGICDDINIFKFNGETLTKKIIDGIIKEKLMAANKKQEVKKNNEFIL